ncbi:MAG: RluA family pseudouridine synthase [Pseudomonadota bacterium]
MFSSAMTAFEILFDGPSPVSGRLDKVVASTIVDLSRARAQQLIKQGHVDVDGGTQTNKTYSITEGQKLYVRQPPAEEWHLEPEEMALDIVYEDPDLVVVNKPVGLVVHPGAGISKGTLVNGLLAHCGEGFTGIGGAERPGIVHRIDKDTSGLLVVAKTQSAFDGLVTQFQEHSIERRYQAIVFGQPLPAVGRIDKPIGRHGNQRTKMAIRSIDRGGKPAVTHYHVKATYSLGKKPIASLIECRLETGRTHQIRVHLATLGHPLVGDAVYNQGRRSACDAVNSFPRQALHACHLGFIHPKNGELLTFNQKFPADMERLVSAMETMHS